MTARADELVAWARQRTREATPSKTARAKALDHIRRVTLAHAHLWEAVS